MKKFLFSFLLVFALASIAGAQDKLTTNQQLVQKTVIDMFQGLADRDPAKIKLNCTADIIILENGEVWNLDTLVQAVSENTSADFKRINTFEFIDTKISGKTGWTTYYNQAEVTRNGKNRTVKWIETAILVKEDGQWKIKTLHSTLLKRS